MSVRSGTKLNLRLIIWRPPPYSGLQTRVLYRRSRHFPVIAFVICIALQLSCANAIAVLGLFAAVRAPDKAHDHNGQFGRLDRLGDVHLETGAQGAHPVFDSPICRKRHRRDISAALSLPLARSEER